MEFDFSTLNWFDITVISVVFLSTLFAFFRGFIKAGFSLLTWIGAAIAASFFYPYIYEFAQQKIASEKMAIAISSVGAFGLFFIVIAFISSRLIFTLRKQRGGAVDRTLGFAFGFARGVLVICLIFFSIGLTSKALQIGTEENPGPKWFTEAKSYNMLKVFSHSALAALPGDVPGRFVEWIDKAKDVSVSMVESEIKSGGGTLSRTLGESERNLMKKVIAVLPKEDMGKVYKKYEGSTAELSDLERMAIFREILKLYDENVKSGSVEKEKMLSDKELSELNVALNGSEEAADEEKLKETGYKEFNIKQMDRLIGNVQ